jgi:hypothetical protein
LTKQKQPVASSPPTKKYPEVKSLQIAAYTVGVRLAQAFVLANLGCVQTRHRDLLAAMIRLTRAFTNLMEEIKATTRICELGQDILKDCVELARRPEESYLTSRNSLYSACEERLRLFQEDFVTTLQSIGEKDQSLSDWFQLGVTVSDGELDDPIERFTGKRLRDGDKIWAFRDPDKFDALLKQLRIDENFLGRKPADGELDVLFEELPTYLIKPWSQIEAGLRNLAANCTTSPAEPTEGMKLRLTVTLKPPQAILDGCTFILEYDQAACLKMLLDDPGDWVSGPQIKKKFEISHPDFEISRADRVFPKLPEEIYKLIESGGTKGFRIPLASLRQK